MNLFIDIETIPTQLDWAIEEIRAKIKPPGNIKKPESIQKWMDENASVEANKAIHKTGFDGSISEIICISYAVDDSAPKCIGRKLGESEKDMLESFFLSASNDLSALSKQAINSPTWVGHYICEFDLRFLWQRMIINKANSCGLMPPKNAKPWSDNVFDTYFEWSGAKSKGFGSLDSLCKIFEIEGKGDIDGSKVWQYVKDGKYEEVFEYCNEDVKKVQQLHGFMTDF